MPASEGDQTTPTTTFEIESSQDQNISEQNDFINLDTAGLRRSPRDHQPGSLPPNCFMVKSKCFASSFSKNVIAGMKKYFLVNDKVAAYTDAVNLYYDGTISMMYAFVTSKNADNDTYTLKNMLKEDDIVKFIEAMLKELDDHNSRNHRKFMDRDQMSKNIKTVMSIWSFKRKNSRW